MKQPLFGTSYVPRDGESTLDEIEPKSIVISTQVEYIHRKIVYKSLVLFFFLEVRHSVERILLGYIWAIESKTIASWQFRATIFSECPTIDVVLSRLL